MKKTKIVFWVTTLAIFLFEGVMPALTSNTELARSGITSLGYPLYFVAILTVFKILGSLALIIPKVSPRIKEWAYAGFGIDFICAFVSIIIVTGSITMALLPAAFFVILVLSYRSYHKLLRMRQGVAGK
ncbi:MAG: DoxX family protein [Patescibacteria group bacterium]